MSNPTATPHPINRPAEMLIPVPLGWTWTLTAPDGYTVAGYPPAYSPEVRTTINDRPPAATDHPTWFDDGISVPVTFGTGPTLPWDILAVRINHAPANNATPATASIQLFNDHWINNLSPAGIANLATQGHVLLDALTHAAQTPTADRIKLTGLHAAVTTDRGPAREQEILTATVDHTPATGTKPPMTTVGIHIAADCQITGLDPSALADFTTRAHAYLDRLTHALQPTA